MRLRPQDASFLAEFEKQVRKTIDGCKAVVGSTACSSQRQWQRQVFAMSERAVLEKRGGITVLKLLGVAAIAREERPRSQTQRVRCHVDVERDVEKQAVRRQSCIATIEDRPLSLSKRAVSSRERLAMRPW